MVTVRIVTHNHCRYIATAIECAQARNVDFPVEIVLGEDGFAEGTWEIVAGCAERYPGRISPRLSERNIRSKEVVARASGCGTTKEPTATDHFLGEGGLHLCRVRLPMEKACRDLGREPTVNFGTACRRCLAGPAFAGYPVEGGENTLRSSSGLTQRNPENGV